MKVLDHGYLKVTQSWGSDEDIISAARMSTGGGFKSWKPYEGHPKGDQGLLEYLYRNNHSTPFEMAGMTIEVSAPILVFRQWHRHRTQSYNEASARYSPLPDVHWLPSLERCKPNDKDPSKQKRSAESLRITKQLDQASLLDWQNSLSDLQIFSEDVYKKGLMIGVPKEVARAAVLVSRYSTMRASANLRNWLGFLTLRADPHAQEEIRVYAEALQTQLGMSFPRTLKLFAGG